MNKCKCIHLNVHAEKEKNKFACVQGKFECAQGFLREAREEKKNYIKVLSP